MILAAVLDISLSVPAVNFGISKTAASNAGVIWLLMPIFLFLLSVTFLKEKLRPQTLAGIFLALAGSLIIIGKPWHSGISASLAGNLLVLLAVFLNSLAIIAVKPVTKHIHHWQVGSLYYLIGTVPLIIYAGTQLRHWHISQTTAPSWAAFVACILTSTLSNPLFYYALRSKTIQNVSVYQYIDPLVAVAGAWLLLAERPSALFYLGGILIGVGVYIVERKARTPLA